MILAISTMKTVMKRRRRRRRRRRKTCIPPKVHPRLCLLIVASSFKTKRTSSAETIREHSDSDSSDQALDLAALKRARRENPGTISILGSLSGTDGNLEDDEAKSNAEKAKELFELPSTEKIITGRYYSTPC